MLTKRLKVIIISVVIVFLFGALLSKSREAISCEMVEYLKFDRIEHHVYVSKDMSQSEREHFLELVKLSLARVHQIYGLTRGQPIFIASTHASSLKPYFLNEYGSTAFTPRRSCIAVGPNGMNIDVISHELVHAEIFHIVGFWKRLFFIPTWFDEGVAMQVDFREKYVDHKFVGERNELVTIESLFYGFQFFAGDDYDLINHGAAP